MKSKLFLVGCLAALVATTGFAARREQLNVNELTVTKIKLGTTETEITATGAELNVMDGVTATTDEINRAADISANHRTLNVTAATQTSAVTSADAVIALASSGQATGSTNTLVIAQPYPVGNQIMFRVTSGSTNLVKIADSTTVMALGSDVELGATDTLVLYFAATNEAVKVSTSDN